MMKWDKLVAWKLGKIGIFVMVCGMMKCGERESIFTIFTEGGSV